MMWYRQNAWEATSDAVSKTWLAVDEDLHREEAESPVAFQKAEAPTLRMSSGQIFITFPIRVGAQVAAVKSEILRQLKRVTADNGTLSVQSEVHRAEELVTFNMAKLNLGKPAVAGMSITSKLTIQMRVPQQEGVRPSVSFVKQGALTDDELSVFSAALRAANKVISPADTTPAAAPPPPVMRDLLGDDLGAGILGFVRHMEEVRDAFSEIREAWAEVGAEWEHMHDRPGEPDSPTYGNRRTGEQAGDAQGFPAERRRPRLMPGQQRRQPLQGPPEREEEKFEYGSQEADQAAQQLQSLGTMVYPPGNKAAIDWGILAGYADQKQQIEDTMLLALLHPEVYETIAKGTRRHFANNKARAVLFEGPPGTGKTTSARVIASQASVPLVYVPLEAVASKWYGESERLLSEVFKAAEMLPGCIIFLDEVDSLATSRNSEMHEATRRLLGVLLRHLDGFETNKRSVVIAATNRKEDLDPALLSRFNTSVQFGLPDESCRAEILHQYAKHLTDQEVASVAAASPGMAGRDLKDLSEQAERRWASKIIRKVVEPDQLPPVAEYIAAANQRVKEREAKQRRTQLPFAML
ncbi:MAG: 26S protease regulatory [Trebouxia sp. A1-2]|nr:MAG: 26S protease regulatory [Trebouxia sp. A1-2]